MKILARLTALIMVLAVALSLRAEDSLLSREALGKIRIGQTAKELLSLEGKPPAQGKDTLWEATGDWVQEWKYPATGLTFALASSTQGGAKTVLSITATIGCKLATKRGIKIGSAEADARKAYQDVQAKDSPASGDSFVAGSMVEGVFFTFKAGKVIKIYLGPGAE